MNLGPLSIVSRGSHVKYFLRSGMVLEGIVEEDTAAQIVLRSLDGESLMIIHRPTEDIMLTKVLLQPPSEEEVVEQPEPPKPIAPSEMQEKIKGKLHATLQMADDPELQKKNVEELRQLVHQQEREILAQKKREHFGVPGAAKTTKYSTSFLPKLHPTRSAYQPGKLPSWAYGRPPKDK